jgi:hypothetical protein
MLTRSRILSRSLSMFTIATRLLSHPSKHDVLFLSLAHVIAIFFCAYVSRIDHITAPLLVWLRQVSHARPMHTHIHIYTCTYIHYMRLHQDPQRREGNIHSYAHARQKKDVHNKTPSLCTCNISLEVCGLEMREETLCEQARRGLVSSMAFDACYRMPVLGHLCFRAEGKEVLMYRDDTNHLICMGASPLVVATACPGFSNGGIPLQTSENTWSVTCPLYR